MEIERGLDHNGWLQWQQKRQQKWDIADLRAT